MNWSIYDQQTRHLFTGTEDECDAWIDARDWAVATINARDRFLIVSLYR